MKTKTTIFKTILIALAMLGGVNLTWADTSTLYNWGITTDGDATVWTDAEKSNWGASALFNETLGLGVSNSAKGTLTATRTLTVDDTAILTYTAKWHVVVGYSKDNYALLSLGNYVSIMVGGDKKLYVTANGEESEGVSLSFYTASDNKTHSTTVDVSCTINTVTNRITALTIGDSISTKYTAGSAIVMDGARTSNTVTLSKKATGGRLISSRLKSLKIVEETQALSKYGYIIKYMTDTDDDATIVKTEEMTADENKVYDGSAVYAESPFWESATKYYATDDATTMFTIDSDNKVCKVKVREASTWNWTLKGKCGEIDLGAITSGIVTEGEQVNTYWKHMLLYNQKLYKKDMSSNSFKTSFTPSEDNYVTELDYTATDYDNVIMLIEAEDVATLTIPSTNVAQSNRSSGGNGAYAATDVTLFSLPAGSYKFSARAGAYSKGVFTYGSSALLTVDCNNTSAPSLQSSSEFTLTESTPINVAKYVNITGGGDYGCLDYFFVQQTAVNISAVDNLGYTFSSTLPLDFSGTSVRAYIATYDSGNDVIRLTQKTKVPANTGVLIFSDSELTDQSIPVCAESTDDVTGNKLVAVSSAMTLSAAEGDVENYVLAIEGGKAVFQLVKTNSASMSAGQAYLQIPKRTAEGARSLRIVFDDETTDISATLNDRGQMTNDKFIYNLQGQRVTQPSKGLFIKNGRKVVIK